MTYAWSDMIADYRVGMQVFVCFDSKYEIGMLMTFLLCIQLQEVCFIYRWTRGCYRDTVQQQIALSPCTPLSLSPTSFGSCGVISFPTQP
jgi:hypothetical protein